MKKVTFIFTVTALSVFMYLGSTSNPVVASSKKGILTDTTKKEKKPAAKSEAKPASTPSDSTKSVK